MASFVSWNTISTTKLLRSLTVPRFIWVQSTFARVIPSGNCQQRKYVENMLTEHGTISANRTTTTLKQTPREMRFETKCGQESVPGSTEARHRIRHEAPGELPGKTRNISAERWTSACTTPKVFSDSDCASDRGWTYWTWSMRVPQHNRWIAQSSCEAAHIATTAATNEANLNSLCSWLVNNAWTFTCFPVCKTSVTWMYDFFGCKLRLPPIIFDSAKMAGAKNVADFNTKPGLSHQFGVVPIPKQFRFSVVWEIWLRFLSLCYDHTRVPRLMCAAHRFPGECHNFGHRDGLQICWDVVWNHVADSENGRRLWEDERGGQQNPLFQKFSTLLLNLFYFFAEPVHDVHNIHTVPCHITKRVAVVQANGGLKCNAHTRRIETM